MNKPQLANLYQQQSRRQSDRDALPSAEALSALVEGEAGAETERLLSDVGRSGLHADLLRLARDLAPESARLGVALERTFDAVAPHHRRMSRARHAPRHGWIRIAVSLAAGLVVAVAVWVGRHQAAPSADALIAAHQAQRPDKIFAAADRGARGDEIFHARFAPDTIFKAKFSGG